MDVLKSLTRASKKVFTWPLDYPALRQRIIFDLVQDHYGELDIRVPLGHGLTCPVVSQEAWINLMEIFFEDEYGPVFEQIPLPRRWLDLGCYVGYFSLYLVGISLLLRGSFIQAHGIPLHRLPLG